MLKQLSAEPPARGGEGERKQNWVSNWQSCKGCVRLLGLLGTATTLAYRRQSPGVRINAHSVTQATPGRDENQGGGRQGERFEERWQILWEKAMTTAEAETKKNCFTIDLGVLCASVCVCVACPLSTPCCHAPFASGGAAAASSQNPRSCVTTYCHINKSSNAHTR